MVLLLLVLLDSLHLLLILSDLMLLVSDQVTQLHLLLNQVLRLSKRPHKLISFLLLHLIDLVLVSHVDPLQVLFFVV